MVLSHLCFSFTNLFIRSIKSRNVSKSLYYSGSPFSLILCNIIFLIVQQIEFRLVSVSHFVRTLQFQFKQFLQPSLIFIPELETRNVFRIPLHEIWYSCKYFEKQNWTPSPDIGPIRLFLLSIDWFILSNVIKLEIFLSFSSSTITLRNFFFSVIVHHHRGFKNLPNNCIYWCFLFF